MTSTPLKTSDISIIIPALNEEKNIANIPDSLKESVGEMLIVDGGSSDHTVQVAKKKGLRVVLTSPGRASQLNHGAQCSCGSILLFLHADTQLPENFTTPVLHTLARPNVIAGAFSLAIRNSSPSLAFIACCANIRSRYLQLPYGDQAVFIRKDQFETLGGFPLLPIMEDYVFIKKAKRCGKVCTLSQKVTTSSRRWQRLGVLRTTIINQLIVLGYTLHIPPERLASLYRC